MLLKVLKWYLMKCDSMRSVCEKMKTCLYTNAAKWIRGVVHEYIHQATIWNELGVGTYVHMYVKSIFKNYLKIHFDRETKTKG